MFCRSEKEQEEPNESSETHQEVSKASIVRFYSLQTQEIVKEMSDFDDQDDTVVTCIQSNHKVIVLVSKFIIIYKYKYTYKYVYVYVYVYVYTLNIITCIFIYVLCILHSLMLSSLLCIYFISSSF
jgi:hypothetical protein